MAVTDISELRKKRQAKRTRNMIIKMFVVLLICGCIMIIVFTKDMWYPHISSVLSAVPEAARNEQNSPELAEGSFPIKVEGGMGYQLYNMDDFLALLDDSKFHVYSADGKIMNEKQHTYANPILCVEGSKALIYDEGGRDFALEGKYKNVYEKTADNVIYLAKLSKSDYAAVVTKSDKFLAMLKIYDENGREVFTYYSYDSRIINVTFTDNSSGCVVTVLTAEGGELKSKMIRFDFSDTEPKWVSDSVSALALDVRFTSDGNIVMIGDTCIASFNHDGMLISEYTYTNPIINYDRADDLTAIVTENSDLRRSELLMFDGSLCTSPVMVSINYGSDQVFTDGTEVYILNTDGIDIYNRQGTLTGAIKLEDDYEDLCKIGKYVYLLGYDSINRINFVG